MGYGLQGSRFLSTLDTCHGIKVRYGYPIRKRQKKTYQAVRASCRTRPGRNVWGSWGRASWTWRGRGSCRVCPPQCAGSSPWSRPRPCWSPNHRRTRQPRLQIISGFQIRIHLKRIRIQHFRLNTDPDPIRLQGFHDQKFKNIYSWQNYYFFLTKEAFSQKKRSSTSKHEIS